MSNNSKGIPGKMGGLAVKNMIEDVEKRMANGEQVSAAPSSPEEAALLQQVKAENKNSSHSAQ